MGMHLPAGPCFLGREPSKTSSCWMSWLGLAAGCHGLAGLAPADGPLQITIRDFVRASCSFYAFISAEELQGRRVMLAHMISRRVVGISKSKK